MFSNSGSEAIHADHPLEHLPPGQYKGSICGKPAYIFVTPNAPNGDPLYYGSAILVEAEGASDTKRHYARIIDNAGIEYDEGGDLGDLDNEDDDMDYEEDEDEDA